MSEINDAVMRMNVDAEDLIATIRKDLAKAAYACGKSALEIGEYHRSEEYLQVAMRYDRKNPIYCAAYSYVQNELVKVRQMYTFQDSRWRE